MKNLTKVVKALAVTGVLAVSLMATSGSADAASLKLNTSIIAPVITVDTTGVTWEQTDAGFTLGVTWE